MLPKTASLVLAFLLAFGCGAKEEPKKRAPKGPADDKIHLEELHRTETPTRTHISGRTEFANAPVRLKTTGKKLAAADHAALAKGFCAELQTAAKLSCLEPMKKTKGKAEEDERQASDVKLDWTRIDDNLIVEMGGNMLLTEGWESLSLYLRLGVESKRKPSGAEYFEELGGELAYRWLEELVAYKKGLTSRRPPSTAVKWVAAPGYYRSKSWEGGLLYGFSEIVGKQVWTFQKAKKTKEALLLLIGEDGAVLSADAFQAGRVDTKRRGWGARGDAGREALLIVIPVEDEELGGQGFWVVGLTRNGTSKILARGKGLARSPALITGAGDVYLVGTADGKASLFRIALMGSSGLVSELPVGWGDAVPDRFDLFWLERDKLVIVPGPPAQQVLLVDTAGASDKQGYQQLPTKPVYTWRAPEKRAALDRDRFQVASDGDGALVILDRVPAAGGKTHDHKVTRVDASGEVVWAKELGSDVAFEELAVVGEVVAVLGDEVRFVGLADGKELGSDKRKASAITAGPEGVLVACAPPGLVAYEKLKPTREVRLDDGCARVAPMGEDGFLASRFLWALAVGPVSTW